MKLKNAALQELYETIVNGSFSFSPYAECPIDKAFEDCDEELSGTATFEHIKRLQSDNDILKRANEALLSANMDLSSKNNKLEQLEKDLDEAKSSANYFRASRDDWRSRAKHEEEEKIEQVKCADSLAEQVEQLKKDRDIWVRNNGEKQAEIAELKKQLDSALEAEKTVNNSRYKWAQKWLSTKQNLETKLNEAEVKYRRLEKEHEKLTSDYQELSIKLKRIQVDVGRESRLLWDMLQNVNDTQPNEFDVECESMHDVIGMDLEDFLDAYKKWQDQKEIDRMRDYLERFCLGRLCYYCPLHTDGFNCSRGKWMAGIPDEDIKRYYEKACGCGLYTLKDAKLLDSATMERVNRGITKACASFCAAVRDADIKITENVRRNSWECTLEAKVDVNKDLLDKVCGIVPVEEEHKLEYGDAVRVSWSNFDYMYIGPDEHRIRLFDPKYHCVIFVSSTEKLTYQGCKIVLTDEDDLRKIWKDKK